MSDDNSIDPRAAIHQFQPHGLPFSCSPDDTARELETAWAAGFFDGEGHTGCTKKNVKGRVHYRYVRLFIEQVNKENLIRLQQVIGGRMRLMKMTNPRWKPRWRLFVTGIQSVRAIELMWPYLGTAKREQALRAMRNGRAGQGKHWHSLQTHCKRGHPFAGDNLKIGQGGRRICVACNAIHQKAYHARKRAKPA